MLLETGNLRLEADDQVATLWLDAAGAGANVLSSRFLDDLDKSGFMNRVWQGKS